jgi:hypothetical protein
VQVDLPRLRSGCVAILDHALVAIPRAVHQDVDRLGLADDQVVNVTRSPVM